MDESNSKKADADSPENEVLNNFLKQASESYLTEDYSKALNIYNKCLTEANERKENKLTVFLIKYMISCCHVQSEKLDDLAEAVMTLQTMDKELQLQFPALQCLLAQAHCKLFRFDLALEALQKGEDIFENNAMSSPAIFYIPGTKSIIPLSKKDNSDWLKVKNESSTWHPPDAICADLDCNCITKPYVKPSRNIYIADPAFNGMVTVCCNNKTTACSLTFHPACWKAKKDKMYPLNKISDKDMAGTACFTPNCANNDIPCVVSSITITDKSGVVKTTIKEAPSTNWTINNKSTPNISSKGVIKKVKLSTPKKYDDCKHITLTTSNRSLNFGPKKSFYKPDQIVVLKHPLQDYNQSCGEENFIFSYFESYVDRNLVTVADVLSKFQEICEYLPNKEIDIMEFLISSGNFKVQEKDSWPIGNSNVLSEENMMYNQKDSSSISYNSQSTSSPYVFKTDGHVNQSNSQIDNYQSVKLKKHKMVDDAEDVGVCFNDLVMNDDDDDINVSEQLKTSVKDETATWEQSSALSSESKPNIAIQRGSQNRKLKEYIEQLESELKNMAESYDVKIRDKDNMIKDLNDKIKEKDSQLNQFVQEKEDLNQKVLACENMYQMITELKQDFEKLQENNLKMKSEAVDMYEKNQDLERQLAESNSMENRRKKILACFQDEFKDVQDKINSEWEQKYASLKREFEDKTHAEIEQKHKHNEKSIQVFLLNKCLNNQYTGNKNYMNGLIDICIVVLEAINKLNLWVEKIMGLRMIDGSEWTKRINYLHSAVTDHQLEYSRLLQELHTESDEKDLLDISINLPSLSLPPVQSLDSIIETALDKLFNYICQKTPPFLKTPVPQPLAQFHRFPPGMPPPGLPYNHQFHPNILQYQMRPLRPSMHQMPQSSPYSYSPNQQQISQVQNLVPSKDEKNSRPAPQSTIYTPTSKNAVEEQCKVESADDHLDTAQKPVEKIPKSDQKENKPSELKIDLLDSKVFEKRMEKIRNTFNNITLSVKNVPVDEKLNLSEGAHMNNLKTNFNIEPNKQIKEEKNLNTTAEPAKENCEEKIKHVSKKPEVAEKFKEYLKTYGKFTKDDDQNISANSNSSAISTALKKTGKEFLLSALKKRYPGSTETDLVEIIEEIRQKHHGSLSGLRISQILDESKEFFANKQHLHILRYFNDGMVNPLKNQV